MSNTFLTEPSKQIPVIYEADVCVIGGSATGVFAAVRAARQGARVVIVEKQNSFGGVATNGLVSVWHTFKDKVQKKQIVAGLSEEVLSRMSEIDSRAGYCDSHFFNPTELKIELDKILVESGVKIYLHTYYAGLLRDGNKVEAVFVENKDGRGAIRAGFFIDATGDGDLCRDLGIEHYTNDNVQPPSAVCLMQGRFPDLHLENMFQRYGEEFGLEPDWGWNTFVPGLDGLYMRADTHVFNVMCNKADDLTKAEIVGREKMRKVVRMLRKYGDASQHYALVNACSYIGVRDTFHYKTQYQANYKDLLLGTQYEDCIVRGSYNVDVHSAEEGIMFMQFDGTYTRERNGEITHGNWREEWGIDKNLPIPTFYQLPFRAIVPEKIENLIAAGRMMHADTPSFGALRVMINLNQMGEAAGVAAALAVQQGKTVQQLDGIEVARTLSRGGSANLG